MQIQAAVCREKDGAFTLESVELSEPQADEVVVKIVASGMCHTDLAVRDQHIPLPLPAVLGHEGAGIVAKVGAGVTKFKAGDHVVLSYGSCGKCGNCLSGRPAYCAQFLPFNVGTCRPDGSCTHQQNGKAMTGAFFYQSSFATYALTHVRNVVKVADDLPLEVLAPLGCGIQTGAGAVFNCLRPQAGSSIAIFGAGAVGLSAVMAAAVAGCAVIIVVDVQEARLALAKELGATVVVNARTADSVAAVREASGGGVDSAVEATGLPAVMTPTGAQGLPGVEDVAAEFDDHRDHLVQDVQVELVGPEHLEHGVVVGAEEATSLGEQHPGAGIGRVVDALGTLERQPLLVRIPAGVHVGVADLAPVVRRAGVDAVQVFGDAERIGQPLKRHVVRPLQLEERLVGHIGVGALVVGVDDDASLAHGRAYVLAPSNQSVKPDGA